MSISPTTGLVDLSIPLRSGTLYGTLGAVVSLPPGTRLGPYEIVSAIGAGGMGEVYRAHDTRLARDVALKVLIGNDASRSARFEQEARAVSALKHPNIVTVYDVGVEDGVSYIVSELVEGESLRAMIKRGPVPVRKSVDIAVQIADALAAAHAAGIVHRDLKPENVIVSREGRAKLLDFGLARRVMAAKAAPGDHVPTVSEAGILMGTVGYMSPEQVHGTPADQRSDIFAFGDVVYEMLTGKRLFDRGSAVETMYAILNDDPPQMSGTSRDIPPALESIVRHCLEKGPAERFQSAWDLAFALEAISWASAPTPTISQPRLFRRAASLVLPSFALGSLVTWIILSWSAASTRETVSVNKVTFAQLTDDAGPELFPSLSPDGKWLAYTSKASGNWNVYRQKVGSNEPVNLTKDSPADDTQPAFSPDGKRIAFRSEREGGGIFIMGASGESARRLTNFGFNPAWSPDGKQVLCAEEGITRPEDRQMPVSHVWSVDVATGKKRLITHEDAVQPQWSPHGHRIAYWAIDKGGHRDIWTIPAKGGPPVPVTHDEYVDWCPVWSPDGKYLYFSSDRGKVMNIWRVPIHENSGRALGPPELVTTPSDYSGHLSFSRDGRRLAYVQHVFTATVNWVVFDPGSEVVLNELKQITEPVREATRPALSPDDARLAFSSSGRQAALFVVNTDGTRLRQLADDGHDDRGPRWSPDGRRIAFFSKRTGNREIWTVNADGGGMQQITSLGGPNVAWPVWSPDGNRLAYTIFGLNSFILDLRKTWQKQTPQALPSPGERRELFSAWAWSPDGRRLAGFVQQQDGSYTGIMTYSLDSNRFDKLTDYGVDPIWLSDNRRLLFIHEGKIHLVDSETRKAHEILSIAPQQVAARGFALSRDDREIYFSVAKTEADIWMMTLE